MGKRPKQGILLRSYPINYFLPILVDANPRQEGEGMKMEVMGLLFIPSEILEEIP